MVKFVTLFFEIGPEKTHRHECFFFIQVVRGRPIQYTIQYNTIQYKICKAPCCRGLRGAGEQDS